MKIYSRHLYAPLCGIFTPKSGCVAATHPEFGTNLIQTVLHRCQIVINKHALDQEQQEAYEICQVRFEIPICVRACMSLL